MGFGANCTMLTKNAASNCVANANVCAKGTSALCYSNINASIATCRSNAAACAASKGTSNLCSSNSSTIIKTCNSKGMNCNSGRLSGNTTLFGDCDSVTVEETSGDKCEVENNNYHKGCKLWLQSFNESNLDYAKFKPFCSVTTQGLIAANCNVTANGEAPPALPEPVTLFEAKISSNVPMTPAQLAEASDKVCMTISQDIGCSQICTECSITATANATRRLLASTSYVIKVGALQIVLDANGAVDIADEYASADSLKEVASSIAEVNPAFAADATDSIKLVTNAPTSSPTNSPTKKPTPEPTLAPSKDPTPEPTVAPTNVPTFSDANKLVPPAIIIISTAILMVV